jgi:hypothetical protein
MKYVYTGFVVMFIAYASVASAQSAVVIDDGYIITMMVVKQGSPIQEIDVPHTGDWGLLAVLVDMDISARDSTEFEFSYMIESTTRTSLTHFALFAGTPKLVLYRAEDVDEMIFGGYTIRGDGLETGITYPYTVRGIPDGEKKLRVGMFIHDIFDADESVTCGINGQSAWEFTFVRVNHLTAILPVSWGRAKHVHLGKNSPIGKIFTILSRAWENPLPEGTMLVSRNTSTIAQYQRR